MCCHFFLGLSWWSWLSVCWTVTYSNVCWKNMSQDCELVTRWLQSCTFLKKVCLQLLQKSHFSRVPGCVTRLCWPFKIAVLWHSCPKSHLRCDTREGLPLCLLEHVRAALDSPGQLLSHSHLSQQKLPGLWGVEFKTQFLTSLKTGVTLEAHSWLFFPYSSTSQCRMAIMEDMKMLNVNI